MTSTVRLSKAVAEALLWNEWADTSCSRLEIAMDRLDWEQTPPTKRTRDLRIQDLGQGSGPGMVLGVAEYGRTRLLEVA